MRIMSVRVALVARVFAITYAIFGFSAFIVFAFSDTNSFALPFGILAPLFHLNVNLYLRRSTDVVYNTFLCTGAVLSYALSGWITGVVATFCFNFVAKRTGGIDAEYFSVAEDSAGRPVLPVPIPNEPSAPGSRPFCGR